MAVALQVSSIVISIALIILILLQVKGRRAGQSAGRGRRRGYRPNAPRFGENVVPHHDISYDRISGHCAFLRRHLQLNVKIPWFAIFH